MDLGSSDELDNLFGPSLPLQRSASEAELSVMSRSMDVLDESTGPALKAYMETAGVLKFPRFFHRTTPILWLIDVDGNIRFGLEEVVERDTGALNYILPRNAPRMRDTDVRLGHPALLPPVEPGQQKSARIGGEILFDPSDNYEEDWVLSNNSGRFGKRDHIQRVHLANANKLFAGYGIIMRTFYIST